MSITIQLMLIVPYALLDSLHSMHRLMQACLAFLITLCINAIHSDKALFSIACFHFY